MTPQADGLLAYRSCKRPRPIGLERQQGATRALRSCCARAGRSDAEPEAPQLLRHRGRCGHPALPGHRVPVPGQPERRAACSARRRGGGGHAHLAPAPADGAAAPPLLRVLCSMLPAACLRSWLHAWALGWTPWGLGTVSAPHGTARLARPPRSCCPRRRWTPPRGWPTCTTAGHPSSTVISRALTCWWTATGRSRCLVGGGERQPAVGTRALQAYQSRRLNTQPGRVMGAGRTHCTPCPTNAASNACERRAPPALQTSTCPSTCPSRCAPPPRRP